MSRIKQTGTIRIIGITSCLLIIVVLSLILMAQLQASHQRQEIFDNYFKDALIGSVLIYSKDMTYHEEDYWNSVLDAYAQIRYARLNQRETTYADNHALIKLIDYMYYDILEGYSPSREDASIIYDNSVPSMMYDLLNDLSSESKAKELNDYLLMVKEEQFKNKTSVIEKTYIFEQIHEMPVYERLALNSDVLSQPSFGPVCNLNTYAINMTDSLEIGKKLNDNFTEIRIKGIIPSWYLENRTGSRSSTELGSFKYMLNDTLLYLTPEENALVVNETIVRGDVAYLISDYNDWYYVEMVRPLDSNTIYKGWINKNNLGDYRAFESTTGLEVKIKDDYIPEGYEVFEYGLWGKIYDETETHYLLRLYGASVLELKKEHVEGFYDND